jgi:hypothetical protein
MRQVGDTLVWLGLISVVAAVVYFTPRLADYMAAASADRGQAHENYHAVVLSPDDGHDQDL